MGIPWKKLGTGILKGVAIGAQFDPRIAMIHAAIESVEAAIPSEPGADKKATVVAVSDAFLTSELASLSPAQEQAIRVTRDGYINAYVALRNAQEQLEDAYAALKEAIAAVKA